MPAAWGAARTQPTGPQAVKLIGFVPDRSKGLALLELCCQERGLRGDVALLFVVWIELFFNNDLARAAALLDGALARYERGALFLYLAGYLHRKQGRLAEATAQFERVYACAVELRQLQVRASRATQRRAEARLRAAECDVRARLVRHAGGAV